MELLILDTNLKAIHNIGVFESFIWTDRYDSPGDFELYTYIDGTSFQKLAKDYYIWIKESDRLMVIEDRKIISDVESGNRLIVTGRSLEALLYRRIVWNQTILTGNLQTGVQKLLNENIISPTDTNRQISNFIFEASTDPLITALELEAQFTGDNLYDVIVMICQAYGLGFKITLTDDDKFKFKLYLGVDRSYSQLANPYVIFSPTFNNIINSNFLESSKLMKNITLVGGEGEGVDRKTKTVEVEGGAPAGLSRREMFTDARDVTSNTGTTVLTTAEYLALLEQRGVASLSENSEIQSFDGQAENINSFLYGEDFFLGDIVQLANEYGIESRVRITEIIRSKSASGIDVYPTFSTV